MIPCEHDSRVLAGDVGVRHDEIVAMMRDPARSREYWGNPGVQQEYREVLTRLEPAAGAEPPGAIAGDPGNVAAPAPPDGNAFRT